MTMEHFCAIVVTLQCIAELSENWKLGAADRLWNIL